MLPVGWLLLRLLKSASCFCNSRKNRCCFSSFFKILSSFFFFWSWRSFSLFFVETHLELHHLRKYFIKVFHFFLDFKKNFYSKNLCFLWKEGKFFSSGNIPRNQESLHRVCVFCSTQNCNIVLSEVGGRKKNMNITFWLRDNLTYRFFLNIRYPTHSVVCTIWYLIVV